MPKIFSDLSYNNRTLKPVGRPVDDLAALYKKKDADYNYVVDNQHKIKTALGNIPTAAGSQGDQDLVLAAQQSAAKTMGGFGPDLENKVIDTKNLANDISNNFGLSEIQKSAKQQGAYEGGLKERFDKGEISQGQYNNAVAYSRNNYKGISKDPRTGLYSGSYSGRSVSDYIDVSKEVAGVLKGFKADEIPLTFQGKSIVKDPNGTGYLMYGTNKKVSEADLIESAKTYMKGNDLIQGQFDEEVFYELNGMGKVGINDIKKLLAQGVNTEIAESLGIKSAKDLATLSETLQKQGITLEDAYKTLRKDQLTTDAMQLGVAKEGFEEYKLKYMKPIVDKVGTGTGKGKGSAAERGLMTINRIGVTQRVSPTDYTALRAGKKEITATITTQMAKLKSMQAAIKTDPSISTGVINDLKRSIDTGNRDLEDLERQENSIKSFIVDKSKIDFDAEYAEYVSLQSNRQSIAKSGSPQGMSGGKFKVMSKKKFINDAINHYIQGEDDGLFGSKYIKPSSGLISGSDPEWAASKIAAKMGKMIDNPMTEDAFTFVVGNADKKTHLPYRNLLSVMTQNLKSTPKNFVTPDGKDLFANIEDELNVNLEDIDLNSFKVTPLLEYKNGKPAYAVTVYSNRTKTGKTKNLGKVIVNYNGSPVGHEQLINKISVEEAKFYAAKHAEQPLEGHDLTIYRKLAKTYINSMPGGKELDRLNIYTAQPDVPLKWKINEDSSVNIVPKKASADGDFGDVVFELQNNDGQVFGINKDGKEVWDLPENLKESHTFSGADELKEVVGTQMLNNHLNKPTTPVNDINANKVIDINKVIQAESGGRPDVVNTKSGATGLMQLLPNGHKLGSPVDDFNKLNGTAYTAEDLKKPEVNKQIGTWYLQTKIPQMMARYNLPDNSAYRLIGYNWGIGNLKKWHENGADYNKLPEETRNYITKILN